MWGALASGAEHREATAILALIIWKGSSALGRTGMWRILLSPVLALESQTVQEKELTGTAPERYLERHKHSHHQP